MPPLRTLLNPAYPWRFLKSRLLRRHLEKHPNDRGRAFFPPGHFYSPLLDLESLAAEDHGFANDGADNWEHIPMRDEAQRLLYEELLGAQPALTFPPKATQANRYHFENDWFPLPDAFTLAGFMRREKPRRIIEVGSGFSTAVMLDTLDRFGGSTNITCLEPQPGRLKELLRPDDAKRLTLIPRPVQGVPLALFGELEAGDFLFIDSSHVAKIGSDVTFLLLRVLPILKPGVWVHFHDIFHPMSYPVEWIREGRAWNESLFLRAFLIGNPGYEIRAFNSYAAAVFPAAFWDRLPAFRNWSGSSLWMQRCDG